jgi:hypothetical protein
MQQICRTALWILISASLLLGCSDGSDQSTSVVIPGPGPSATASCAETTPSALQQCLESISVASGSCYFDGDQACENDHPDFLGAMSQLETDVANSCTDGEFLGLSTAATTARLQTACQSHADALTWRTFGGPQGAVWPNADESDRDCLQAAHQQGTQFAQDSLGVINSCLEQGDCTQVESEREALLNAAAAQIIAACPDLGRLVAVQPVTYLERTAQHVDCLAATAHADTDAISLSCGPSFVEELPPRGEWTQIILPEEKWGSRCGDGTDYAIQIKPAPEGEPLDRVLIALQGGGVCIFEDDCRSRLDSHLLNAQDDEPFEVGISSADADNPFANWTKVYLPYCDQAVFSGGGVVEQFSDFEIHRFGSLNLRAGVRAARDIVWTMLDGEGGDGYRPDEIVTLFGGFSAGGYGTIYNYNFMLDELLWPRTIAFPDAGGALDNGGVGVRTLGDIKIPEWGVVEYLPPYCFSGNCAVGPEIYRAFAPRLRQVPQQQLLVLSNQKDNTQQGDAFFSDEAQWINAMRSAYCDTKDLNGIHWYLTSESLESVHVVSIRDEFYYGAVAGERMVDWFARAVNDPDSMGDFAEEGNFVTDIPGSMPFPCDLP